MAITLQEMLPEHWEQVRNIYEEGIQTGDATFEQSAPSWDVWNSSHLEQGRIVAMAGDTVVGWAALTPVSGRCVYAGVAEVSVYVGEVARGQGLGKKLLQLLIEQSEENGFWTLQAGIFPENKASVAIHEQCGFTIVGRREKIGKMHGAWRDTLLLERRSKKVGL